MIGAALPLLFCLVTLCSARPQPGESCRKWCHLLPAVPLLLAYVSGSCWSHLRVSSIWGAELMFGWWEVWAAALHVLCSTAEPAQVLRLVSLRFVFTEFLWSEPGPQRPPFLYLETSIQSSTMSAGRGWAGLAVFLLPARFHPGQNLFCTIAPPNEQSLERHHFSQVVPSVSVSGSFLTTKPFWNGGWGFDQLFGRWLWLSVLTCTHFTDY